MCNFCGELVNCPIGEKRTVVVDTPEVKKTTDAYGNGLNIGDGIMFVDKYEDYTDAGIIRDVYTDDGVQYGGGFKISHCPFCGEKLI